MVECQASIHNYEQVLNYVTETLSHVERLNPKYSQLEIELLTRCGHPCGVFFSLQGPREVRLTAIWETDSNSILFYGSRGERVQRTRLVNPPQLEVHALKSQTLAA